MKTISVILTMFVFAACMPEDSKSLSGAATVYDWYQAGMHYKVFERTNGGLFEVNITKDSLEVISHKNIAK
jgi:hypothetical protein